MREAILGGAVLDLQLRLLGFCWGQLWQFKRLYSAPWGMGKLLAKGGAVG